jgi:hypothetical protein
MAAAGEWGKSERGTRGSLPRTHLGPRRLEEAVWRRRSEGGGGAKGGGAVGGRGARQCSIGAVWGDGEVVAALNRRRRSVWGGEKIFPARSPASSGFFSKSGRTPAATGDATARAAAVNSCRRVRPVVVP